MWWIDVRTFTHVDNIKSRMALIHPYGLYVMILAPICGHASDPEAQYHAAGDSILARLLLSPCSGSLI